MYSSYRSSAPVSISRRDSEAFGFRLEECSELMQNSIWHFWCLRARFIELAAVWLIDDSIQQGCPACRLPVVPEQLICGPGALAAACFIAAGAGRRGQGAAYHWHSLSSREGSCRGQLLQLVTYVVYSSRMLQVSTVYGPQAC